jgi:glycosyltransferase involved in cell wall biosynthesis
MKPRVSVLLPVRNGAAYLPEAVSSVMQQTLEEWELVAVLDGCTDASEAILREAGDARIRVVTMRTKGGVAWALNAGLSVCAAPLVARLDADDACREDRLERQLAEFARRPELGVVGSAATVMDERSRPCGERAVPIGPDAVGHRLLWRNALIHPSTVFRRDLVIAAGGYDERFCRLQDYDLWLRLIPMAVLDNIDDPLIRYRLHAGQHSRGRLLSRGDVARLHHSRIAAGRALGRPRLEGWVQSSAWAIGQVRHQVGRAA